MLLYVVYTHISYKRHNCACFLLHVITETLNVSHFVTGRPGGGLDLKSGFPCPRGVLFSEGSVSLNSGANHTS